MKSVQIADVVRVTLTSMDEEHRHVHGSFKRADGP